MRQRWAGLLLLVAAAAGCKPNAERVVEAHRAAIVKQLERAAAIQKALAAVPPVTVDGVSATDPPMLVVPLDKDTPLPTATVVYAEDLAELRLDHTEPFSINGRVAGTTILTECASLLARGKYATERTEPAHPIIAEKYLQKCESLRYLLVLRIRDKQSLSLVGDVVAFDLATARPLGGFRLDVTSGGRTDTVTHDRVVSTRTVGVGRSRRTERTIARDTSSVNADESALQGELYLTLRSSIRAHVPKATVVE
jgi:hypothetical protein